jgi:methylase of polypeptide subunit release factors
MREAALHTVCSQLDRLLPDVELACLTASLQDFMAIYFTGSRAYTVALHTLFDLCWGSGRTVFGVASAVGLDVHGVDS